MFAMVMSLSHAVATADDNFVELAVYPPKVTLDHADDSQALVAVATRADGVSLDVTDEVEWNTASVAEQVELNVGSLHPKANGAGTLTAQFSGLSAQCEVEVKAIELVRPVSYRHDVIPVLVRAGCNSGACHGSSRGKDGFRMSLFGFDPAGDYERLTREFSTRRINRALPEDSLLLVKSVGEVPHTGGKRFEHDSVYYDKLRDWIESDVPNDLEGAPLVSSLAIYPPRAVLEGEAAEQQFVAVATYSDGRTRDVTNLAVFSSNNDATAAIDSTGLAKAGLRGEAFVMGRFDTHTVGSQVLVLPEGIEYQPPTTPPANYIDELVDAKLATLRLDPSGMATDEEFLRRVTIDIVGMLPTPAETQAFVTDTDPNKRSNRIDLLLEREEFSLIWGMKWAELVMVRSENNRVDYKPMFLYSQWLKRQLDAGVPLDEMVRDLLSASGGSFSEPEVNFYQIEPDTKKIAENVAQAFLGIRVQCAQCHNHPFDRWTMDDYYGFTAFFAQIGRKRSDDYRETIVFNRGGGETNHPVGGRVMAPKFLGGETPDTKGHDRRALVAEWITSPENPYFAPNIANRVWAHFLGVGIVDPVDDVRVSNPASNPELLSTLGAKLVEYKYDLRQLVRDICNSNAYQRSTVANASNEADRYNFARALTRRLPAETLLDCLCQVTESVEKFRGLPLGARAVEIADGNTSTYFLTTFGRAKRQSVCACEVKGEPTLSQALHLLNGSAVHNKISQGKVVEQLLDAGKTPADVASDIYLRCLSRLPTEQEREKIATALGEAERPVAELQDLFWAVLNSREFLFNH
ncbi:MAG: DUF1549 and DUF1553 domain-containing protein [Aeoliella sp.]